MDPKQPAQRTCPECGSDKYLFRGRKKIPAAAGQEEAMETKYRCTACEHEWKERTPINVQSPRP